MHSTCFTGLLSTGISTSIHTNTKEKRSSVQWEVCIFVNLEYRSLGGQRLGGQLGPLCPCQDQASHIIYQSKASDGFSPLDFFENVGFIQHPRGRIVSTTNMKVNLKRILQGMKPIYGPWCCTNLIVEDIVAIL